MSLSQDLLILAHLALWAQVGVITRVYLSKFFVLGCFGQWGPCLAGSDGVFTGSLPANMLGSLVMGALAPSSVLELESQKPVTILPAQHPWQRNIPLHIGLRTGFCGSLTTFGTWQVEVMTIAIRHNAWVNAIVASIIALSCSILSYVVGMQIALAVDRYLLTDDHEDVLIKRTSFRIEEVAAQREGRPISLGTAEQERELELERDIPRSSVSPARDKGAAKRLTRARSSMEMLAGKKTHSVTLLLLALSLAGWAVGAAFENDHLWIRVSFFSALFGIFGCWLRYALAQLLNYRAQGKWAWYPLGTLVANLFGTSIAFAMLAVQTEQSLGYWASVLTEAVTTGFCGALTTVSTFVAEVVKFSSLFPDEVHVYSYLLHTFLGAMALGVAIYGWAGWAT